MNIHKTSGLFKSLVAVTEKKSEIKIYKNFIRTLEALENMDLSKAQLQSIEGKLQILELGVKPENHKKYYKRKLAEFMAYLKEEHSLVPEKYYRESWMGLGMCFGAALGSFLWVFNLEMESNSTTFGLVIGMCIGAAMGTHMDAKAKKEGRVLKDVKNKC